MLPKNLLLKPEENSSIYVSDVNEEHFQNQDHFHNDLELNLILGGTGLRFVGDSVMAFKENDLVLLGPNIPHFWKNDLIQVNATGELQEAQAIVIRFDEKFLGQGQSSLPEMQLFKEMLDKSKRGLLISGDGKERIISSIKKLVHYQGIERLIIFLGILNAIFKTCQLSELSSAGFMTGLNSKNERRMNLVYNTIVNHFQEKISLEEIAVRAKMNPSAFSRYFSQWTGSSVTGFLQKVRISYACKLLREGDTAISEVIKLSGFYNQAYFNKLFSAHMNVTPNQYRKRIMSR